MHKPTISRWGKDIRIDFGRVAGKRLLLRAPTMAEAESKAKEHWDTITRLGVEAARVPSHVLLEAVEAIGELEAGTAIRRPSLRELVREHLARVAGADSLPISVETVAGEYLRSQGERGLRPDSMRTLKAEIFPFVLRLGSMPLGQVGGDTIKAWLSFEETAPSTFRKHVRYLSGFFEFAIRKGHIGTNPCKSIELPKVTRKMPEFMTASNVELMFRQCEHECATAIPILALGFFAGIRPSEIARLRFDDIKPEQGIITIRPEVSKIRRARHVTMSENLKAWLAKYPFVGPGGYEKRLAWILAKNEIKWTPDCARHTFATHHLASFQDAARTAHEMGHTSGVDMLYTHYRGLATKADAEMYWGIRPC